MIRVFSRFLALLTVGFLVLSSTGKAETITLKSYSFLANMTLHAKYPGGQKQTIPFTYTDSETITISVPALTTRGRIMLSPIAANQVPGTDGGHGYSIEVCESN